MTWRHMYKRFLQPKALDEDTRRKELILSILLLGVICLGGVLFAMTLVKQITHGTGYEGIPPLYVFFIVDFFIALFVVARRGWRTQVAYIFVGIFFALASWLIVRWGIALPQGILAYSLVVVMAGVLISSRTAFYVTGLTSLTLLLIMYLYRVGIIHFDLGWMVSPGGFSDVIGYSVTFLVIAVVAWLSNREIDRSLTRARQSEKELLKERSLLEVKVRERTKALEEAQMEKMLDLQRFAEFGRQSATLLHELANPLTSVSLDLEQLEGTGRSKLIRRAREGITHMEQYVDAARRQLRNQAEIRVFNVSDEIFRVIEMLESKMTRQDVNIVFEDSAKHLQLNGDSVRFSHIIANLLSNAIDAYDEVDSKESRVVSVNVIEKDKKIEMTVHDYGRGITPSQMPRIFESFYTTKQSRGTGIGLAITKQAVEDAFHGTITVTSNKKTGTQFVVRLPLE
jgi:signal transduction histidine kinase